LTLHGQDAVPRVLEGRRFCRTEKGSRIREQLEGWQRFYGVDIDSVVCSPSDGLPTDWLEAVQGVVARLVWIEDDRLAHLVRAWREFVPGPPWLRATLMALLFCVPAPTPANPWAAPWSDADEAYAWLSAWFCSQLRDLDEAAECTQIVATYCHCDVPF
jgi:hypothetical protein